MIHRRRSTKVVQNPRKKDKLIEGKALHRQRFENVVRYLARVTDNRLGMNPGWGILPADALRSLQAKNARPAQGSAEPPAG